MTSTKLGLFLTPHVTIEWQFIQSKSTYPHIPLTCVTSLMNVPLQKDWVVWQQQRKSNDSQTLFNFLDEKQNISQFWSNKIGFPHWLGCNALIPMTSHLPCKRMKTKKKNLIYRKTFVERDICSKNATLIGHRLKN